MHVHVPTELGHSERRDSVGQLCAKAEGIVAISARASGTARQCGGRGGWGGCGSHLLQVHGGPGCDQHLDDLQVAAGGGPEECGDAWSKERIPLPISISSYVPFASR